MKFGDIFLKSWKEFKSHFKVNSKLVFYWVFIPSLFSLISFVLFLHTGILTWKYLEIGLNILSIFLTALASTSILYYTLFDKNDYSSSLRGGRIFFWKYVLLVLVQIIFLFGLALAFVFPAIIFGVYWILAPYILIKENKKVIESLKGSFKLIKHNWWRIFGYSIILGFILLGISAVFSVLSLPTNIMVSLEFIKNAETPFSPAPLTNLSILNAFINKLLSLLSKFVIIPLEIIFFKYVYLALINKK